MGGYIMNPDNIEIYYLDTLCDFDLATLSKAEMIDKYDIIVDNILIHLDEIIKNKK